MALDIQSILDAVASHAAASGHFDHPIGTHEPKNAPGNGLSCAVWVEEVSAPRGASGLAASSALLVLNVRLYTPVVQEPPDAIDPNLTAALDALFRAYIGDLELGGEVRHVDVRGIYGTPLRTRAGYLRFDTGELYRMYTITLPVVIDDLWTEAP